MPTDDKELPDDEPTDSADVDAAPVLSPEELDILEDDHVYQIEDGRFVIRSDDAPEGSLDDEREEDLPLDTLAADDESPAAAGTEVELDRDDLFDLLETYVDSVDARYGFHVTAKFEGEVDQRAVFTNDVVTAFDSLVSWYAHHAGGETPVEDVLGILLVEMDLPVRYPASTLRRYLDVHDLGPEDSIADLLAVLDDRGFRFPH